MFVVRKRVRHEYGHDDTPDPHAQYHAAFPDRESADRHCRTVNRTELLANLPRHPDPDGSPFDRGWDAATSLPQPVFCDWLREADIDPPPEKARPYTPPRRPDWQPAAEWAEYLAEDRRHHETGRWRHWWESVVQRDKLTDAQLRRVWQGLDRYELYEVVEAADAGPEPAGEVVYAVVARHWEYDDCHYCGANDVRTVYRSRERADEECKRLAEAADGDYWNGGPREFVVVELFHAPEE